MFQGFVCCRELGGTWECNSTSHLSMMPKFPFPLLMVSFDWLNPTTTNTHITTIDVFGEDLEENMFGVETTIEESLHALVIGELFLLRRLLICMCNRSTCLMAHS